MSNVQKAQKVGGILSALAMRSILERNPTKSEKHLKNFTYIIDKSTQYSTSKWSLFSYEEYERREAVYFTLIDSLLNNSVKDNQKNPITFDYEAIGWNSNGNLNVFRPKKTFHNWLLTPKSYQATLGVILEGLSFEIQNKTNNNNLLQNINTFFNEVHGVGHLPNYELSQLSGCPLNGHYKRSMIFEFAFNIRNAWIIRQVISDAFSGIKFTHPNHIKIP